MRSLLISAVLAVSAWGQGGVTSYPLSGGGGTVGPAGPTGATGSAGATGATGPTGPGGTGNAASNVTTTFSATPTYTCGSASAGSTTLFTMSTALTANITASTLASCTAGQTIAFHFTQDGTGGRTVAMPTNFDALTVDATASVSTDALYAYDGTNGRLLSVNGKSTPFLLSQAPERAAPVTGTSCGSGAGCMWFDSTSHVPSFKTNNAATIFMPVAGVAISGTPSTGYVPTATSATTATWQAAAGGAPGGSSGQLQYNNASAFGGASNTVVLNGGTNVIAGALAANARLLVTANVAQNTAAIAVTQANVTVECAGGVTITRSTASTNLFTVTGAGFKLANCILDGNSVNGGSIVSGGSGADKMTITGNTFQNAGTNSSLGVINIAGGSDDVIELNRGISITDYFITVDGSAATADNGLIRGNKVTGTNPGIQVLSATNTTQAWTITENNIYSGAGKCYGIGGSIPDIGAIHVTDNHCTLTGTSASQGYVFNGLANGALVTGNSFDGAGQVNSGGFEIGDCVGGTVTGNSVRGAFGVSIQILDNGGTNPCAVTGNAAEVGVPNGAVSTYGIFVGNSGQANSGINLTGNSITFLAITYYANTQAIHVGGGSGNFSMGNCTLSGNNIYDNGALLNGAATISAIGIGTTADALIGTTNDCMISGGNVMVPAKGSGTSSTGITIGSGASDTQVGEVHIVPGTAAVLVSDSGTRSRINTHVAKGTCVLGTSCAVTFANRDIFTGSGTYACTATDQTAAAAVKVVNTSATVATFTGTGTDTLSYVCTGY